MVVLPSILVIATIYFFQLFLRIRNIAEHAGVKSENDFNNARRRMQIS